MISYNRIYASLPVSKEILSLTNSLSIHLIHQKNNNNLTYSYVFLLTYTHTLNLSFSRSLVHSYLEMFLIYPQHKRRRQQQYEAKLNICIIYIYVYCFFCINVIWSLFIHVVAVFLVSRAFVCIFEFFKIKKKYSM